MTGAIAREAPPRSGDRALATLGLLLAVVLAWIAYRPLLALEHFGWDTYPMILTSRVQSAADLAANFTEELMHGRYPLGRFYRPVASLAIAFDYALWGSAPFGYHLTNHAIVAAGVVAVAALARRLVRAPWAGLVAAFVFALHPIHFALVPIAARRADMLSALLTVLVLVALPRPRTRPSAGRGALLALLAFAAAGAKETGAIALPLALGLAFLEGTAAFAPRARDALRRSLGASAGVLAFVGIRTLVLGGLGGRAETSILGALAAAPGLLRGYGGLLVKPQPPLLGPVALAVLALALVATLASLWRSDRAAILFLALWLALLACITGLAGEVRTWYGAPFLPLYAVLTALLAEGARRSASEGRRATGALASALALFLVASPLRYCGLLHDYAEWRELSAWEREFLDDARAKLDDAAPGTVVEVPGLPRALRSDLANVRAAGLDLYSVQAWAELEMADKRIRVVEGGDPVAAAGEIVLRVAKGAPERSR